MSEGDHGLPGDEYGELEISELQLHRFQSVLLAVRFVRHAEDILETGLDPVLRRKVLGEEMVTLDVDPTILKVWKGWVWGATRESTYEGLKGPVEAVIRRGQLLKLVK